MMRKYLAVVSTILLIQAYATGSLAHELRPTVADVRTDTRPLEIGLRLDLEAIVAGVGPEHESADESDETSLYQALRQATPAELEQRFRSMHSEFLASIDIKGVDEQTFATQIHSVDIPAVGDPRLPRDTRITLHVPDASTSISWQWNEKLGPLIFRDVDPNGFSQYLAAGQRSDVINLEGMHSQSVPRSILGYFFVGVEHIIPKGLDHILFVVGIFLLAPAFKPIFYQISMFTLAHTMTLAMGTIGAINLPGNIVEPLIALSISVICLENLYQRPVGSIRLLLVFSFGLLHGLGFAGVLGEVGLPRDQFFRSLIAFNIGVEVAQLVVVITCFAIAGWWFRHKSWYRTVITIPASLLIGATGLFWSLQRVGAIS